MGIKSMRCDGFDQAIIGIIEIPETRLVYSKQRMVEILILDGQTREEAIEYLEFNTWCVQGEGYPVYLDIMDTEEVCQYVENA